MVNLFCSQKTHNQLTPVKTKICAGQTIQMTRLNRMPLQNCQLVMEEKKQEQWSLNRVSAMPICGWWWSGAHSYMERENFLFFSNLWEDN